MADLDTLRPEVAQALGFIAGDIDIIRAELLRLTRERDHARQMHADRDEELQDALARAENAEAELAALKAKIEAAPVVACPKTLVHAGNTMQTEFLEYTHERMPGGCNSWAGKRVHLVVEE